MAALGNKPFFAPGSRVPLGPRTDDIMFDKGTQLTLNEGLTQGVGKAHRSVTYAHFDFRNYRRSFIQAAKVK